MQSLNKTCLFAGSFDPVTLGHMDIIGKAAMMYEKVVVAIGVNPDKKYLFTLQERLDMLKSACAMYESVTVTSYDNMTADFMRERGITDYVRGVRNDEDLIYEQECFSVTKKLNPAVNLVIFRCSKDVRQISSTLVRELIKEGKSLSEYVPYAVTEKLAEYMKSKKQ